LNTSSMACRRLWRGRGPAQPAHTMPTHAQLPAATLTASTSPPAALTRPSCSTRRVSSTAIRSGRSGRATRRRCVPTCSRRSHSRGGGKATTIFCPRRRRPPPSCNRSLPPRAWPRGDAPVGRVTSPTPTWPAYIRQLTACTQGWCRVQGGLMRAASGRGASGRVSWRVQGTGRACHWVGARRPRPCCPACSPAPACRHGSASSSPTTASLAPSSSTTRALRPA